MSEGQHSNRAGALPVYGGLFQVKSRISRYVSYLELNYIYYKDGTQYSLQRKPKKNVEPLSHSAVK